MSGLVDQSPSISCSMVGTVPRLSNGQAGRPVPEHITLSGRYSPQTFKWAGWLTSPRAYKARWSVQSPNFQMGRLVDQSPSIQCSVVGTVRKLSNGQAGRPVPKHTILGGRCSPQTFKWAGWSTSPRAYNARWSVQSPGMSYTVLHQIHLSFGKSISPH